MSIGSLQMNFSEVLLIVGFGFVIGWIFFSATGAAKRGERAQFVEVAPTLMTSLGILGTFVGIVVGLFSFDPSQIDESIKDLLGGLRTAFVTSVFGMGSTILFKWIISRNHQQTDNSVVLDEVGPKEIFGQLQKQSESMELLVRAVGGSEENSMVGQLKLLRSDVNDFRSSQQRAHQGFEDKLWQQLREFSEMLSKSATEQVIEALRQVIIDFNRNLTEQFGDNFKRLDESVKKLVDWQSEYKTQLERMIELFDQGVQSIDATKGAVVEIKEQTGRIPGDMQALANVINVNQHQIQELSRHLEAFMALRQQAVLAVPEIQQKLEEVGQQLRDGAENMRTVILEGAADFGEHVKSANFSIEHMAKDVALKTESISSELTDAMVKVEQNTDRIKNGVSEAVSVAMDAVQNNVTKASDVALKVVTDAAQGMAIEAEKAQKQSADSYQKLADNISATMDMVQANMTKASNTAMKAVTNTADGLVAEAERAQKQAADSFNQMAENVNREVDAILQSVRTDVERSLGGVEKQIQEAVTLTGEAVNSQLRAVDSALEQQLNKALSDLGTALASIARRLVDIYDSQSSDLATSQGRRP